MSVKSFFASLFKGVGVVVRNVFTTAVESGITDEVMKLAISTVKTASLKLADNAAKREWAVTELMKVGMPESLARLAVELGVKVLKSELSKLG